METGQKALLHYILMVSIAIIGEGFDGDATTRIEQTDDFQILRIHQFDQIFHDDVYTVFMEIAMITEAEEVELQALALHHQRAWDVVNNDVSEVRLARFWAQ